MFVTSCWGAASKDYSSFLASRVVSAIGMAPYEILVLATIKDIYYVHERGTRIAVWNLFLLCGICGAGFISGYISPKLKKLAISGAKKAASPVKAGFPSLWLVLSTKKREQAGGDDVEGWVKTQQASANR